MKKLLLAIIVCLIVLLTLHCWRRKHRCTKCGGCSCRGVCRDDLAGTYYDSITYADDIDYNDHLATVGLGLAPPGKVDLIVDYPEPPEQLRLTKITPSGNDALRNMLVHSDKVNQCSMRYSRVAPNRTGANITYDAQYEADRQRLMSVNNDGYYVDENQPVTSVPLDSEDQYWRSRERYGAYSNIYTMLPVPCRGHPAPGAAGLFVGRREPFLTQPDEAEAFNLNRRHSDNKVFDILYRGAMGLDIDTVDMSEQKITMGTNGYTYRDD